MDVYAALGIRKERIEPRQAWQNCGEIIVCDTFDEMLQEADRIASEHVQVLTRDPEYFLGAAHVKKFGAQPQLLVKFLDSGTRLHFQAHPTREFAQRVLGAPSGKTVCANTTGFQPAPP